MHQRDKKSRVHVPYSNERVRPRRAVRLAAQWCCTSRESPPHGRDRLIPLLTSRWMEQACGRFRGRARDQRGHRGTPTHAHTIKPNETTDTHRNGTPRWPEPPAYSPVHYEDEEGTGTVPVDERSQTVAQPAPQHLSDDRPTPRADENESRQRARGITTSTPSHERLPRDLEEGWAGVPVEAHEDAERGGNEFH